MIGSTPKSAILTSETALLVIDFQKEYFEGSLPVPDAREAMENAGKLVAWADANKINVYNIQHHNPIGAPVFAMDGDTVAFHPDIRPAKHHHVLQKTSVSVFPTTDLDARLKAQGIKTVIVAGLMTHACVSGAARDAVPLGYDVIVASDACATRDITGPNGKTVSHKTLHDASLATLADAFAEVLDTEAILALPTG
ncbi:isochorismatase family protein [uncultured Nitratireductor sp.]|uniref:cysteine hydrolase family protein n=1 Tax=uncultured Nitratireductor sp. TaxID=520953 RepID=UPI0025E4D344|nr:isochorismatase family protein [uncultured Nitratireductor sp.]